MKILIADDMEGATGVVDWNHVFPEDGEFERFRRLLTRDVNAAIRGAFKGGADEVVVTDGHNYARNLVIEELDPRARLNTGAPSDLAMVEGVDQGVDAVIFVAYHARAGALNAILCHSWTRTTTNVWLNGRITGEFGLNGSVAGSFGAPVLMVTGDRAVCEEAREWSPEVETVVVKSASGRYAAECLPPAQTGIMIEDAAERAVRRFAAGQAPKLMAPQTPVVMRVEFTTPNQVDNASQLLDSVRIDGRTIEFTRESMVEAYRSFRAACSLAAK